MDSYYRRRETIRQKARAYYEANRDKLVKANRELYAANGARYNLTARLKRYGLTPESYAALIARDPTCAICGAVTSGSRPLGIDHDHATGRVRGRLCNACNGLLHRVERIPYWAERAIYYLHRDD